MSIERLHIRYESGTEPHFVVYVRYRHEFPLAIKLPDGSILRLRLEEVEE